MTDQSLAARVAVLESTIDILIGVLLTRSSLEYDDLETIVDSVEERAFESNDPDQERGAERLAKKWLSDRVSLKESVNATLADIAKRRT